MSHALVVETCLAVLSTSIWCVDTGTTDHVCISLQGFQETRKLSDGEITISLRDATKVVVVAVGDVCLYFSRNKTMVLKNCLYVPTFRKNLISVSMLIKDGYSISFDDKVVIKKK